MLFRIFSNPHLHPSFSIFQQEYVCKYSSELIVKKINLKLWKINGLKKQFFGQISDIKHFSKYFCVCYENSVQQHNIWIHQYFQIFRPLELFCKILKVAFVLLCTLCDQAGSWNDCLKLKFPPLFTLNRVFNFSPIQYRQSSLGRWVSTELNYINIVTQQLLKFEVVTTCATRFQTFVIEYKL